MSETQQYTPEQIAEMDALGDWGSEETAQNLSDISLKNFEELIESAYCLKAEISALDSQIDGLKAQLNTKQSLILKILETTNQTSYKSAFGTVIRTKKFSVTQPKTPEDKAAFFDYLRQKGIFEDLVNVNSNTLNAFYKSELENAQEKGDLNFKIPGVGEPKYYENVTLRKG